MPLLRRFKRRPDQAVVAVRLPADSDGLHYRKWGGPQFGKPGDWLVDNAGEVYTVDAESFARSYRPVARGQYVKTTPVWARQAPSAGTVATREGRTAYSAGDWLVSNREDGSDAYAVAAGVFESRYMPDD